MLSLLPYELIYKIFNNLELVDIEELLIINHPIFRCVIENIIKIRYTILIQKYTSFPDRSLMTTEKMIDALFNYSTSNFRSLIPQEAGINSIHFKVKGRWVIKLYMVDEDTGDEIYYNDVFYYENISDAEKAIVCIYDHFNNYNSEEEEEEDEEKDEEEEEENEEKDKKNITCVSHCFSGGITGLFVWRLEII